VSNLSKSKGIDSVIECAELFERQGLAVEMVLAGPMDEAARSVVEPALARLKNLTYLGPLTPEAVKRFYADIDVFLFPTRHVHEAEPLAIIDALAAGVPVIANDRGCIGYLLGDSAGCILTSAEQFAETAANQVRAWSENPTALEEASRGARARLAALHDEAGRQLARLVQSLCSADPVGIGSVSPARRH
jgi:glycosyltransferase involved in cell wall biosynthesis